MNESSERQSAAALIAALSLGNFAIGMGAFVVIGVLDPIADDFSLTAGQAGWVLTGYAIAYALGSPLAVALTGRWARHQVLLFGFALFASGSLASALAPAIEWLHAARIMTALGAGLITPVAASVALYVSAPGEQGKALARVFFGLTLAQVLGVPAGSWLGYTFGWPIAFLVVVVLSIGSAIAILRQVPRQLDFQVNSLRTLGEALMDVPSFLSVMFTASYIAAIYVLYTYLAPLLHERQAFERDGVTLVLLVFGVGAVLGNLLGGRLTDRFGPMWTLGLACIAQISLMPLFAFLPMPNGWLMLLTLVWSVCGWSFMVAQQARLVRQTPARQNVVLALNAAAIYVGVAVGSALGGWVLDGFGYPALGLAAGLFSVLALGHLLGSERLARRDRPVGEAIG